MSGIKMLLIFELIMIAVNLWHNSIAKYGILSRPSLNSMKKTSNFDTF